MPKYSLAHYQFKRYVEEERHTETEAAAAEGRCHGQLTSEAYAHVKAQADSVYRDPFERLDFWTAVEAGLIDGGAERMHDEALAAMPQPTFLDLARAAVEAERIWCRGTSATIWQNERHAATVSYSASVGDLYLVLEKDTENDVLDGVVDRR